MAEQSEPLLVGLDLNVNNNYQSLPLKNDKNSSVAITQNVAVDSSIKPHVESESKSNETTDLELSLFYDYPDLSDYTSEEQDEEDQTETETTTGTEVTSESDDDLTDTETGEEYSDDDEEDDLGGERQSGDGEEQPEKGKLDDDEDEKNPAYIPRKGAFYEHDFRRGGELNDSENSIQGVKKNLEGDARWLHDMYDAKQQAPKTREELLAEYGYDILSLSKPPKAPPKIKKRTNSTESKKHKISEFLPRLAVIDTTEGGQDCILHFDDEDFIPYDQPSIVSGPRSIVREAPRNKRNSVNFMRNKPAKLSQGDKLYFEPVVNVEGYPNRRAGQKTNSRTHSYTSRSDCRNWREADRDGLHKLGGLARSKHEDQNRPATKNSQKYTYDNNKSGDSVKTVSTSASINADTRAIPDTLVSSRENVQTINVTITTREKTKSYAKERRGKYASSHEPKQADKSGGKSIPAPDGLVLNQPKTTSPVIREPLFDPALPPPNFFQHQPGACRPPVRINPILSSLPLDGSGRSYKPPHISKSFSFTGMPLSEAVSTDRKMQEVLPAQIVPTGPVMSACLSKPEQLTMPLDFSSPPPLVRPPSVFSNDVSIQTASPITKPKKVYHGDITYYPPELQRRARVPQKKRPRSAIPIVNPQDLLDLGEAECIKTEFDNRGSSVLSNIDGNENDKSTVK